MLYYISCLYGTEIGRQDEFVIQMQSADDQLITSDGIPFITSLSYDKCQYLIEIHDNENGYFSSFCHWSS
jgi:hypothetical protein